MAPIPSLVKAALEARPERVVLASSAERRGAALPLDFRAWGNVLAPALRTLAEAGLAGVALVSPDLARVKAAHAVGVRGVELYTGALVDLPRPSASRRSRALGDAARLAAKLRLEVGLGGRLDEQSLAAVLEAAPIATSVAGGARLRGRARRWSASIVPTRDLRERAAGAELRRTARPAAELPARARIPARSLRMLGDAWPLVTAAEMRALDRHTIETLGIPGALLMELRGRGGGREAARCAAPGAASGSSAGRATTAGTASWRRATSTCAACRSARAGRGPGALARRRRGELGTRAQALGVAIDRARAAPEPGAVIVDAIFGTGLSRAVDGPAAAAIRRIREARPACRVVAVDLPSGLDADTGQPLGDAVAADVTVTIGLPEARARARARAGSRGPHRGGAHRHRGRAPGRRAARGALDARRRSARACPRDRATGTRAASATCSWWPAPRARRAPRRSRRSGRARVGAGLVTIACPERTNPVLEAACSEVMTAPVPEAAGSCFGRAAEKPVLELAAARDVVALGPGIGRGEETRAFVRHVTRALASPLVLDADGLVAFADALAELRARRAPTVLTPHPGRGGAAARQHARPR